jgi:hypothetical protein
VQERTPTDEHLFANLKEARQIIEEWRIDYNRASEHPSCYVIEEKRLCWPGCDPAGISGSVVCPFGD